MRFYKKKVSAKTKYAKTLIFHEPILINTVVMVYADFWISMCQTPVLVYPFCHLYSSIPNKIFKMTYNVI